MNCTNLNIVSAGRDLTSSPVAALPLADGHIKLILRNAAETVVIEANDSDPLPVEYISFGAADNSKPEFFYNCRNNADPLLSFDAMELDEKCQATLETFDATFDSYNKQEIVAADGWYRIPLAVLGGIQFDVALMAFNLDRNSLYYQLCECKWSEQ